MISAFKYRRYLLLLAVVVFCAIVYRCQLSTSEHSATTFIGGEIDNPKTNTVILLHTNGMVLDTLVLNKNNRFSKHIKNLKTNVYVIMHGNEYQNVILEPNDSLLLRLNTYDFDESLVFTGKGAKKNNFLVKTYLDNEIDAKKISKGDTMNPEVFNAFVENKRLKRLDIFNAFQVKNKLSQFATSVITANINYSTYAFKELYPFAYFGSTKLVHIKDLPEDFYSYRSTIDYNAKSLRNFYSYNKFLTSHFDNLALKAFYKNNPYHSKFNRLEINYNLAKLHLIDSLVTDTTLKDNLLHNKARNFITQTVNYNFKHAEVMLNAFLTKSSNTSDKSNLKAFVKTLKNLQPGNTIPNLEIKSFKGNTTNLHSAITKPTVLYFWSTKYNAQYRNSHTRILELQNTFPNVNFIAINIDNASTTNTLWRNTIMSYAFSKDMEYQFLNSKKALQQLGIDYVNNAILIDRQMMIFKPSINLYSTALERALKKLTE